ncbi:MAG: SpoIVB peptidase [Firmicutes bacterium]|nr:SpoIVB peptidase [Bacillota bacterium]
MGTHRNAWRRTVALGVLIVFAAVSLQLRAVWQVPAELRLLPGQELSFDLGRFITAEDVSASGWVFADGASLVIRSGELGAARLKMRLLGVIPLRSVLVSVVPELEVVPGGQAIGVLVSSQGLVVAQTTQVVDADGSIRFPAREAGLRPGDVLVEMSGVPLYSVQQVHDLVDEHGRQGKPVELTVVRQGVRMKRLIRPVPVRISGPSSPLIQYRLGLRLESPAAGVGTLTFYDPVMMRFGGLGHMITDGLNNRVEVNQGRIVEATIRGIQQGARGFPGEKIGVFDGRSGEMGTIEKNTRFGIYGVLHRLPRHALHTEPVPVALAHEVRPGPAEMLTVIEGQTVESFAVNIVQVHPHRRHDGRGLVIEISDPRLLELTRGIVQGMSGSPILQDGKLVGAVTHVFVNDPARGYGILAEWMVYEAEIGSNAKDGQEFGPVNRNKILP